MQTDKKRCVHVDLFRLKVILGQDKQHFKALFHVGGKVVVKYLLTDKRQL